MTAHTWFITGSSRGFGRSLAAAALAAGDQVLATARKPEQLDDLVSQYGDRVHPVALDVTDTDATDAAFAAAEQRFGRVDVVVNNAGYANLAPVETADAADFRRQFETNFWGVYNVSKAAIPLLRRHGGGIVIQFSSTGGRIGGAAGLGSYQAAKFAVDGLTRVLATETASMGIRYLVVEPSGFATDWAGSSMTIEDVPENYRATVGALGDLLRSGTTQIGDPDRAAQILVRIVHSDTLPTHLLLGGFAVQGALLYSRHQIEEATTWQAVSASADQGAQYPVDLPTT
ncbi:SDR family NAD(P)-dependent oxidoreductase [Nocardia panacis]|uniref:SDR family NAD(P)-dependent oxidoreductase n=1 Tax=Nocardia panacis TaxID=2340916 RepID=A0A3A4KLM6_9NOCA|nr:SDR family NAD(P)-dependent oxidoreductase [Nocardia panacis]RJO75829.1 SDR family NAD(P)-dependent oxidoreductase [Nocardia panacis]